MSTEGSLARTFLSAFSAGRNLAAPQLEEALQAALARAHQTGIAVDERELVEAIAARIKPERASESTRGGDAGPGSDPARRSASGPDGDSTRGSDPAGDGLDHAIAALHVEDLARVLAASRGDRAALRWLDERLLDAVRSTTSRMGDAAFRDEVAQQLRAKLLLGTAGRGPKLLDFGARGSLSRWLEAAAVRLALNLKAGDARRKWEPLPSSGPPGSNPHASMVRGEYGPRVQAALEEVLAALPVRERNLLRLYFVQGLTVEEIGRMEGTHKSTVSRWLTRVRAGVLAQVRERLSAGLGVTAAELDSLVADVQSQLHLSVSRVLATPS